MAVTMPVRTMGAMATMAGDATSTRAWGVGRAVSRTGQLLSDASSTGDVEDWWAGQCPCDSAGAWHEASHHARAGAARATTQATIAIRTRDTLPVYAPAWKGGTCQPG